MIPSIDDRLASIVRALSEVILPHLPADASLAQEQGQLAIGHLQILRAQIDQVADFEREELDDYVTLANALCEKVSGGSQTGAAIAAVRGAVDNADGLGVREQRVAVNEAVEELLEAISNDGDDKAGDAASALILEHEYARAQKDRAWCAPFGFDSVQGDSA